MDALERFTDDAAALHKSMDTRGLKAPDTLYRAVEVHLNVDDLAFLRQIRSSRRVKYQHMARLLELNNSVYRILMQMFSGRDLLNLYMETIF